MYFKKIIFEFHFNSKFKTARVHEKETESDSKYEQFES
jgi:hypothetical protein